MEYRMYLNVRIDKNGNIARESYVDDQIVINDIVPDSVLGYLTGRVTIDEEFTLYSYFTMLNKYPKLQEVDQWIPEYVEVFNRKKAQSLEPSDTEIKYIVLTHMIELAEVEMSESALLRTAEEFSNVIDSEIYNVINIKTVAEDYVDVKSATYYGHVNGNVSMNDSETYSIGFTTIDDLLQCKIILSDTLMVSNSNPKHSKYTHTKYRNDRGYNLFELVTEIIYELSFHGNEEDKEEQFEELQLAIKELDDMLEMKNHKRGDSTNE